MQGAVDELVHQALFAETHLMFGRMHVHVHLARVAFQEQHEGRMAPMEQHVGISLAHRMGHGAVAHGAAVDVEILLVGAGARRGRQSDPAA